MIDRIYILTTIGMLLLSVGCQSPLRQKEVRYVDPALPMSLSRPELVDYLNKQNQGLNGWCCKSTRLAVRLPNGFTPRLKGSIACQAPQRFRLTASQTLARADLGSNDDRCWVYVKPGEPAVMTWKHEDTALLQRIPNGVPYIDPNWLMLVLGITPLNTDDYTLSKCPGDDRELWLTAIEEGPSGRPMRRVIKVDTIRGVIREHAVFDSEANPLVRATLSQHKSCNGHLIPKVVKLHFPQMDSEMTLTFGDIETNPDLPEELWKLPDHKIKVVDIGQAIRNRMIAQGEAPALASSLENFKPPRARLERPNFNTPLEKSAYAPPVDRLIDGTTASTSRADEQSAPVFDATTGTEIAAPDWDTNVKTRQVSFEQNAPETAPPKRRSLWSFWRR